MGAEICHLNANQQYRLGTAHQELAAISEKMQAKKYAKLKKQPKPYIK